MLESRDVIAARRSVVGFCGCESKRAGRQDWTAGFESGYTGYTAAACSTYGTGQQTSLTALLSHNWHPHVFAA